MRDAFNESLADVRRRLLEMVNLVQVAVNDATESLLEADGEKAEQVIANDAKLDRLREELEDECYELLTLQSPVATDLRTLISAMKMAGELERMGDLAVHVAKVARMRLPERAVPTKLESILARMASIAELMVGKVGQIIEDNDVQSARELDEIDEQIDKLRRKSFRELFKSDWKHGVEAAVDVALLSRYYERIADHAVSVASRLIFLVTGDLHPDLDQE
ncbi:MAG: phosphate signaling complex protein PhoU [Marmoricola sp.]